MIEKFDWQIRKLKQKMKFHYSKFIYDLDIFESLFFASW